MKSSLSTERLKAAYLAAAELVEIEGECNQPFMDYWEVRYIARMRSKTALTRAKALVAELEAEVAGKAR